jgi:hypothetical protein
VVAFNGIADGSAPVIGLEGLTIFVLGDVDGLHESLEQVGNGVSGSRSYIAADSGGDEACQGEKANEHKDTRSFGLREDMVFLLRVEFWDLLQIEKRNTKYKSRRAMPPGGKPAANGKQKKRQGCQRYSTGRWGKPHPYKRKSLEQVEAHFSTEISIQIGSVPVKDQNRGRFATLQKGSGDDG